MNPPGLGDPKGSDPNAMLTDSVQVFSMNTKPTEFPRDFSTSSLPTEPSSTDRIANGKRKADLAQPDDSIHKKRVRVDGDQLQGSSVAQTSVLDRAKQLPAEIWHHIFTLVPPRTLGRLLLVNKLFYTFLHPTSSVSISSHCSTPHGALQPVNPNAIWRASRRLFWPRMPTPLKDKSELDMWRLVCSTSCQFCTLKGNLHNHEANDQWHRGPGAKGVSPVFPFSVFACGNCLSSKSVKEIDILLSSSIPSPFLPALPMAFVTDEQHVIPPSAMQSETLPSQLQVTKVYWSDHLEQIKVEFETVKLLGSAAAEEWIKGLENRGKEALADASRWEKWGLAGGVHQMQTNLSSLSPVTAAAKVVKPHPSSLQFQGWHSLENSPQNQSYGERSRQVSEQTGISGLAPKVDANGSQSRPSMQQKRTREEVAELKAKRRAEIERRALLLNPPLAPSVLAHIPSFQAALQIITPLDENAWDLLKPRLLAQREKAELREKESDANSRALREKLDVKKARTVIKETRAVTDKDWDEIQGPLRGRISNFADEIIRDGWGNGEKVRKKSSPQFAAEVLLYVRKRFYAEVAKDAAAAVAAGQKPAADPPEGPWTQKLTLENMKWIFDVKIKPHTEPRRKELFLCSGCPGNNKYYGFEGVIQHYAAKHTGALSVGNVVVHWRAEWPEMPPFNPEPRHSFTHQQNQTSATSYPSHETKPSSSYPTYPQGTSPAEIPPTHMYGAPGSLHQQGPGQLASVPPMHRHEPNAPTYGMPHPPQYYAQYPYDGGHPSYPPRPPYGYDGYHYTSYQTPQGPYGSQTPDYSYKIRLNALTRVAKETWGKVAGVKDLPTAVKICVVVHHIAKMFQNDFTEPAPLAMLIDALSTRKEMRPIRNTNGLACKACAMSNQTPERTNFSLPQLTNHFSKRHEGGLESQGAQPMDWRIHMISLPDMTVLRKLNTILENCRPAYDLVADTLPWAFENRPNDALENQAWQGTTQPSLSEISRGLDHVHNHVDGDGTLQWKADVSGKTQQGQAAEISHCDVTKRATKQEMHIKHKTHGSPSQITATPNTVPNLRPASEVYAPTQQKCTTEQTEDRFELTAPVQQPSSHRCRGLDAANEGLVSRDQRRLPSSDGPERHERPRSTHGHLASRSQPSARIDYRDVEPRQHIAVNGSQMHHNSTYRAERFEESSGQVRRPSVLPSSNVAPSGASDDEFSLLNALESHLEQEHEEIIYVDTSGRELGRTTRPVQTRPRPRRIIYRDDAGSGLQHRPPSSGYETYQAGYHSQGTGPRYAPHGFLREADHVSHRVYYDDTRPLPGPPAEAYELVEIRDSQGDYFIRRPIRREEDNHYVRDIRFVRRDSGTHPPYTPTDDHTMLRPAGYAADHRTAPLISTRPTSGVEYGNYDPWPPAPSSRDPTVHQGRR